MRRISDDPCGSGFKRGDRVAVDISPIQTQGLTRFEGVVTGHGLQLKSPNVVRVRKDGTLHSVPISKEFLTLIKSKHA